MTLSEGGHWPQYSYVIPQTYTKTRTQMVGLGIYTPKGTITNDFFAYISTRLGSPRNAQDLERVTGLETRHVRASTLDFCRQMAGAEAPGLLDDASAPREETAVDMAVVAAQRALISAGRDVSEIDTIVGASSSDNDAFPTVAGLVAQRLGLGPIRSTMLKGACACQVEAFQVASEVLAAGSAKLVLLVTTEVLLPNIMHVLDWKTSSLFGEGASAYLLELGEDDSYVINGSDARQATALFFQAPLRKDSIAMAEIDMQILQLYQAGRGEELSQLMSQNMPGYTKMKGKEVYREAPRAMAECIDALVRHAGLSHADVAHIVPHQANSRITKRMGELLIHDYGWPTTTMDTLVDNFRYYGNLSNASIATALAELLGQDKLQDGEWIALPAVGGGLNYGCWLVRYRQLKNRAVISEWLRSA